MIIDFSSPNATLEVAGGKGANLARLKRAGFAVPPGFIVATDAYRAFVAANGLAQVITAALAGLTASDVGPLEQASARIRAAFQAGTLPAEMDDAVRVAYAALGAPAERERAAPVAVRSSATAEDLPDLSFAGQQDTYLNIIGPAPVLAAVVACWSSLWTGR
jgi:phosphoenolpyruvate synthase/pyruvate phosphate dikinase